MFCIARRDPIIAYIAAQFLAEAEKAKLEIDPIDGPSIEKMVNGLYEIEPAVVSRVKQILE